MKFSKKSTIVVDKIFNKMNALVNDHEKELNIPSGRQFDGEEDYERRFDSGFEKNNNVDTDTINSSKTSSSNFSSNSSNSGHDSSSSSKVTDSHLSTGNSNNVSQNSSTLSNNSSKNVTSSAFESNNSGAQEGTTDKSSSYSASSSFSGNVLEDSAQSHRGTNKLPSTGGASTVESSSSAGSNHAGSGVNGNDMSDISQGSSGGDSVSENGVSSTSFGDKIDSAGGSSITSSASNGKPLSSGDSSVSSDDLGKLDENVATIKYMDADGVEREISLADYRESLRQYGLNDDDIDRLFYDGVSLQDLINEIINDEDSSRRSQLYNSQFFIQLKASYNDVDVSQIDENSKTISDLEERKSELNSELTNLRNNTGYDTYQGKIYSSQEARDIADVENEISEIDEQIEELTNSSKQIEIDDYYKDLLSNIGSFADLKSKIAEMESELNSLTSERNNIVSELESCKTTGGITIETASGKQYDVSSLGKVSELEQELSDFEEENGERISQLSKNIKDLNSIVDTIESETYERSELIDPYKNKADFEENCKFNKTEDNFVSDIYEKYNSQIDPQKRDFTITVDKEDEAKLIYYMLNGQIEYNQNSIGSFGVASEDGIVQLYFQWMTEGKDEGIITDEEIQVFNYIYNTEGYEAALDFLKNLEDIVDQRYLSIKTSHDQEFADEHPFLASLGSVVVTPIEGLNAMIVSFNAKCSDDKLLRTNVYSTGDVWRSRVSQNILESGGSEAAFAYNVIMSMIDTGELILVGSVLPGSTTFVSGLLMGSRAYVYTLNDALDRGLSDDKAILLATTSAIVETAMESYSLGHLLNLEEHLSSGVMQLVQETLEKTDDRFTTEFVYCLAGAVSQGFAEGEEEFATEVLNYCFDELISGDLSSFSLTVQNYISQGYSELEAKNMAVNDFKDQLEQAFLGGLASGICFGAFGSISNTHDVSKGIAQTLQQEYNLSSAEAFVTGLEIENMVQSDGNLSLSSASSFNSMNANNYTYNNVSSYRSRMSSDTFNYIDSLFTSGSRICVSHTSSSNVDSIFESGLYLNGRGAMEGYDDIDYEECLNLQDLDARRTGKQSYKQVIIEHGATLDINGILSCFGYDSQGNVDNDLLVQVIQDLRGYKTVSLDSAMYIVSNEEELFETIQKASWGRSEGGNQVDGALIIKIPNTFTYDEVSKGSDIVQMVGDNMCLKPEYIDSFIPVSSNGRFGEVIFNSDNNQQTVSAANSSYSVESFFSTYALNGLGEFSVSDLVSLFTNENSYDSVLLNGSYTKGIEYLQPFHELYERVVNENISLDSTLFTNLKILDNIYVKRVQNLQKMETIFSCTMSSLNIDESRMENQVRGYLDTGNSNLISSNGGARSLIVGMSRQEIEIALNDYLSVRKTENQDNLNKVSTIIENNVMGIGYSYDEAIASIQRYIETGNSSYITSKFGTRSLIESMSIDDVRSGLDLYIYNRNQMSNSSQQALNSQRQSLEANLQIIKQEFSSVVIGGNTYNPSIINRIGNADSRNYSSNPDNYLYGQQFLQILSDSVDIDNVDGQEFLKKLISIKRNNSDFAVICVPGVNNAYEYNGRVYIGANHLAWSDIGTLSHELGHAIHYYYNNTSVPNGWDQIQNSIINSSGISEKVKDFASGMERSFENLKLQAKDDIDSSGSFDYNALLANEIQNIQSFNSIDDYLRSRGMNDSQISNFKNQLGISDSNLFSRWFINRDVNNVARAIVNQMYNANIKAKVEKYQRNNKVHSTALSDIVSTLFGGVQNDGKVSLPNGEEVVFVYSHEQEGYYNEYPSLVFAEIFANFVQLKVNSQVEDLHILREIIGVQAFDYLNVFYNNIVYNNS